MKMQLHLPIVVAILMAAASVTALSQKVTVDYDHHADFTHYKTYCWGKVKTANPLWDERVKDAVNQELSAKGWTLATDNCDATIMAIGIAKEVPTLQTFYDGFGGWRWGGFGTATTTVNYDKIGNLVIDMFDTSNSKLIWRASAENTLSGKPDKNIKTLEKAVHKMFEHFPPKSMG